MKYEQIIELWKLGYSKRYLYELEFYSLRDNEYYRKKSDIFLRRIARKNIDYTIGKEYKRL